ncbi:MAG: ATP-binding protein [Planctomycetales bacterium]|nr:ATP-binding protein [Planctomycetales bacterium]
MQITFPTEFSCQLAKRMLARDIARSAREVAGFDAEVTYCVADPRQPPITAERATASAAPEARTSGMAVVSRTPTAALSAQAQPNNTSRAPVEPTKIDLWEQFVQGSSNQLAWTTANLIVSEPGRLSPVLMHGPNGCGKSHLAAAVAERLRTVKRLRRVVHMSSEQFTNDFMEGLRGGGLPMFRRKYRDVEALILDDIQFFVGKKSTVGELRHTLDNLLRLDKQIVLTADRSLNELQGLGNDLIGRLRGGMVTPLYPLDETTRAEVMRRHFTAVGLEISEDIVEQIASRAAGDGRVLSGIAKRLIAVSSLQTERLTWEQSWNAVFDLVQATQPIVRIVDIERAVCRMFGLEPESLQSANKARRVSQPRMLAMFLARKYTPAAYKEIGEYFGKRRHSTVISAEKTVESWLTEDCSIQVGRGLTVRDALRHVEAQLQVG